MGDFPGDASTVRRARITLNATGIRDYLDLPEGLRVVGVHSEFDPASIIVIVEGDSLDPVPVNTYAPELGGMGIAEVATGPDGRRWRRFGWHRT